VWAGFILSLACAGAALVWRFQVKTEQFIGKGRA
jgi:Na+-driven multidrug efflux pump